MANIAGRTGIVFVADQLLEDCEDAWDVDGGASGTSAAADDDHKVGNKSVKVIVPDGSNNGDILAHEVITPSVDLKTLSYTHLMYWIKSTVAITTAGDLEIGLSHTEHLGGSPVYTDVPVLGTSWKYCQTTITTTALDTIISIGLKLTANDPGACSVYLDDIRAARAIGGINNWTLDYTMDTLDTTDFANGAATNAPRAFISGLSSWSGTFTGLKDGIPLTLFGEVGLSLAESATVTQRWIGKAIITGIHPNVSVDGSVTYTYDFQGTGELTEATT